MDLATFGQLLGPHGRAALTAAAELRPSETTFLACYERLRKSFPPALAKAALETVLLRARAAGKFSRADQLFFTREALEQASGEVVARYRAGRLGSWSCVADLCCGIGGDSLALAAAGLAVEAVELDPLRAAMAAANAAVLGLTDRVHVHTGDVRTVVLGGIAAAFADPARRAAGRRYLDPEEYKPSLSALRDRFPAGFPLAVKVAPGVDVAAVAGPHAEVEFVSVDREMKDCVLWYGPLRSAARRATALPAGATLSADGPVPPLPAGADPDEFVLDPDPAVVRAGLAGLLAEQLGLRAFDPAIALLAAGRPVRSPFVVAYRIEYAERYHLRRLNEWLHQRRVGRVTLVRRGGRVAPEEVERRLKLRGDEHRFVLLTRRGDEPLVLVGTRCV